MQIEVLLAKYFSDWQTEDVVVGLKKYELYDMWSVAAETFYSCVEGDRERKASFCRYMEDCLLPLLLHTEILCGTGDFNVDIHNLTKAAAFLMYDASKFARLTRLQFKTLLEEKIIYRYSLQCESLMLGELIKCLIAIREIKKEDVTPSNPAITPDVPGFSMNWTRRSEDKGDQCSFFANDVYKLFSGFRTPKMLVSLLGNFSDDIMLTVAHVHLFPFLTLMDLMYKCERIRCKPTKGIILFMSRHIQAPADEEDYKPELFRLQKSRAMANEIDRENIKNMISPVFFKYCSRETDKKVFEKYFLKKD